MDKLHEQFFAAMDTNDATILYILMSKIGVDFRAAIFGRYPEKNIA